MWHNRNVDSFVSVNLFLLSRCDDGQRFPKSLHSFTLPVGLNHQLYDRPVLQRETRLQTFCWLQTDKQVRNIYILIIGLISHMFCQRFYKFWDENPAGKKTWNRGLFSCSLVEKCDENHEKCIFCKSKLFSVRLFGDYWFCPLLLLLSST